MNGQEVRKIRDHLGATRAQFGRLMLGAEAQKPWTFVEKLENGDTRPTRVAVRMLSILSAGVVPHDWDSIMNGAPHPGPLAVLQ